MKVIAHPFASIGPDRRRRRRQYRELLSHFGKKIRCEISEHFVIGTKPYFLTSDCFKFCLPIVRLCMHTE